MICSVEPLMLLCYYTYVVFYAHLCRYAFIKSRDCIAKVLSLHLSPFLSPTYVSFICCCQDRRMANPYICDLRALQFVNETINSWRAVKLRRRILALVVGFIQYPDHCQSLGESRTVERSGLQPIT